MQIFWMFLVQMQTFFFCRRRPLRRRRGSRWWWSTRWRSSTRQRTVLDFACRQTNLDELPKVSIAAFLMAHINAKMLSAFSHKIDWNFLSNFLTICLHLALQQRQWRGRRRGWQGGSWQGAPRVQNWQLVQAQAFLTREISLRVPGGWDAAPGGRDATPGARTDHS